MFTFGYDDSTSTYKVVTYRIEVEEENKSVGDGYNCWRNIQSSSWLAG
jgi:hypothetical protein